MGFSIGDAFRQVGGAFKQAARDVRDDVVNTVVDRVSSTVGRAVDRFEPQLHRAAQVVDGLIGLVRGRGPNPDKPHDGALVGANGTTHAASTS